jgi:hypothetical protein
MLSTAESQKKALRLKSNRQQSTIANTLASGVVYHRPFGFFNLFSVFSLNY